MIFFNFISLQLFIQRQATKYLHTTKKLSFRCVIYRSRVLQQAFWMTLISYLEILPSDLHVKFNPENLIFITQLSPYNMLVQILISCISKLSAFRLVWSLVTCLCQHSWLLFLLRLFIFCFTFVVQEYRVQAWFQMLKWKYTFDNKQCY